jgi:triphosphoribosyl-dephospho-CoA synthase
MLEVTARKAGNVHRERDFADTHFLDFLLSAAAIAPAFDRAASVSVGQTILDAIAATRRWTQTNTNLGIVLLIAPLAAVPAKEPLASGVEAVLDGLTVEDARLAYRAIRLAQPGGLGQAADQDVVTEPTLSLTEVMRLAAERDLVALQYVTGFEAVLKLGLPALERGWKPHGWERAIQLAHLRLLAAYGDSLIARKCGAAMAEEARRRAADVLGRGFPDHVEGDPAFRELDNWLRADGNRRNPGATADLITACLFAGLRQGTLDMKAGTTP